MDLRREEGLGIEPEEGLKKRGANKYQKKNRKEGRTIEGGMPKKNSVLTKRCGIRCGGAIHPKVCGH